MKRVFVKEVSHRFVKEMENLIGDVHLGSVPVELYHMNIVNNEDIILGEKTLYTDIGFSIDINDSHIEI